MIESSPGIPPHIALLLNEDFDLRNPRRVTRKLKGMIRDLRDQADASPPENLCDLEQDPFGFRAVLSGGLDLFSGSGACQLPPCRMGYAVNVGRSIALMSDQVTMHDFIRERIQGLRLRATHADVEELAADVYVLKLLKPLIEEGIVQFISPMITACASCMTNFDQRVSSLTSRVVAEFSSAWSVERERAFVAVDAGNTYQPNIVLRFDPTVANKKSDHELVEIVVGRAIRSTMWDARSASMFGGTVFSNSSAGLNALLREDGRSMLSADFRAFAGQRAAELPWVDGLSIRQTIDLRNEASAALPALREFLARRLAAKVDGDATENWDDCVAELREQAQEVRSELAIATSRSASLSRRTKGILGLTVSAVSFAAEGPVAALSGLLGTLGLLHGVPDPNSPHAQSLRAKPGYLLVAAQDILRHAG